MKYGLLVQGLAGFTVREERSNPVGHWIAGCDWEAGDGAGEALLTLDPKEAKAFDDMAAAFEYWRTTSPVQPIRPDGRPNRPLTAFTVEVAAIPEERA